MSTHSTAKELAGRFELIPPAEITLDGEVSEFRAQDIVDAFLEMCEADAVAVTFDRYESCDPSVDFTFVDGTVLHVANPCQEVYPAWVSVWEAA